MKKRSSLSMLTLAVAFSIQTVASAHAFLDHADPRVGASIGAGPSQVRAWFTQELEPAFSKLEVFDSSGNEIDQHDVHVDGSDKTLLVVSVPKLSAGTYKVKWSVVSVDTHRTQGSFNFVVTG